MSQIVTLLAAATTTGASASQPPGTTTQTFQATVVGTGSVSATVLIEATLNGSDWLSIGTITLSGTTRASDGLAVAAPWLLFRANVTAVSGTGAAVTVIMGS
jgi:hypothetical protein